MTRFFVQDEGIYIPTSELAQSFAVLNFVQTNSEGTGTDTLVPTVNTENPNYIADIVTKDLWGFNGSGNIYRMGNVGINNSSPSYSLDISGNLHVTSNTDLDSTLDVDGATTLNNTLDVDGESVFNNTVEFNSSIIDINGEIAGPAAGKTDYRLASIGTGVSWRPAGVETQNTIWVTVDGNDNNSGLLEGDAKRTIGAAAEIAQEGDTIVVRPGVYYENNPIGLRNDVTVTGQDLRLVKVIPLNLTKDVFHVRRGCLIENLSFTTDTISPGVFQDAVGSAAVAFPPINQEEIAISGYIAQGPADEGPSGRWRSPYIRNCTNFMPKSIGMKINGDHATGLTLGADLKSMVCDSFTQYNEAGIGVSITNNGYAQLVSIFTINCDIGIYCDTGGSCDLTNSNSSFGNYGLVANGLGDIEFTGEVLYSTTSETDTITLKNVVDSGDNPRRPYDGQALFFKGILDVNGNPVNEPLVRVQSIKVINGGSGYSPSAPPNVFIRDSLTQSIEPLGPEGIIAELSPNIGNNGEITSIDIINSGRNYLPTQTLEVVIEGSGGATAQVVTEPIYFTISEASEPIEINIGQINAERAVTTVVFNEFIPYLISADTQIELRRISRILTSSHSFEYIGAGTNINSATPFNGAVPIKENEIVSLNGAQIPFTSTDQKGNFDIGEGFQINQPTSTIRGRAFSRAIQAELTPLILALR